MEETMAYNKYWKNAYNCQNPTNKTKQLGWCGIIIGKNPPQHHHTTDVITSKLTTKIFLTTTSKKIMQQKQYKVKTMVVAPLLVT